MIWLDTETYSETPIKHGLFRYAENCEVMLITYAVDDGPVYEWDRAIEPKMPEMLEYALFDLEDDVTAHGAMFDRTVLREGMGLDIPLERWYCTMAQAYAHSLPGGLEKLCDIMKVDQDKRKLKIGKELIRLFCVPRPKNMKLRRATRETHPEEWAQFVDYGRIDVEAMRAVGKKMPKWNYQGFELDLWRLDQRINARGICMDLDLARGAIAAVLGEQARLKDVTQEMTAGYVESATKRDKLLEYILMEHGVDLPDMQKDTLERRINDSDLPIELRNLLAVRLMATTSSTAKYKAAVNGTNSDSRMRGTMQFAGAGRTARWAHRLFQPGNMPRPDMEQDEIEQCIDAIKNGGIDLISDNVMRACSNAIRGVIVAPPGKKLVVGDLANIEGRKAAWLAGEDWKLRAFEDYDAGVGPDLYKVAYGKAFKIDPKDVSKPQRQIGKVMELMLQYEGGVGAFITGAATYGIDLDKMAEAALPTIPGHVLQESIEFYEWTVKKKRSTFGLPRDTFLACDALKRLWRYAHPAISSYWGELKDAVISAINKPGQTFNARRLVVRRDGAWLKIQLPSGRYLCYPSPQVGDDGRISYMGINQYSRQWSRIYTYGGKLFENITQAAARDVLAANMPLVEAAGYEIVLSVHDELITETPDSEEYSADGLCDLMATVPDWAEGLPLASAGFEAARYRKD